MTGISKSMRESTARGRSTRRAFSGALVGTGVAVLAARPAANSAALRQGTTPEAVPEPVLVYFLLENERRGQLVGAVGRTVDPGEERRVGAATIEALIAGPTEDEEEIGLTTALPVDVELLSAERDPDTGVVTADFSSNFALPGDASTETSAQQIELTTPQPDASQEPADATIDPADMSDDVVGAEERFPEIRLRQAQVVHSLTQFDTITGVIFTVDGSPLPVYDSLGDLIDGAATRETFEDLSPLILIETPVPFATVGATFPVRGTANTFEAAFSLRVVTPDNEIVLDQPAMATSGSGTRGTFDESVTLPDVVQPGEFTLLAYEISAMDGDEVSVVEIPLIFEQ